MRWSVGAVTFALIAVTRVCAAQTLAPPAPPPAAASASASALTVPWRIPSEPPLVFGRRPEAEPVWYGWQTLIVFGASVAVGIAIGAAGAPGEGVILGSTGIVLGGPVVHWAHGHVGRGFGSLGINLGIPLVVGLLGAVVGAGVNSRGDFIPEGAVVGGGIGLGLGALGALAIDVGVLAYEAPSRSGVSAGWTIAPDIRLAADRGTVGVMGSF